VQFPTIAKAPREEGEPLFLFCPEEGWHTGVWFEGRCVDALTLEEELHPTHYAEMFPDPEDGEGSSRAWEATRAFG
jgi:hypothetical protein